MAISIAGTLVGWRASEWSGKARDADQRAINLTIQRQQALSSDQQIVLSDQRALGPYTEHVRRAYLLQRDAGRAKRRGLAGAAARLRVESQTERLLAESSDVFSAAAPQESRGSVTYDAAAGLRALHAENTDLVRFRPETPRAEAAHAHRKAVNLTGVAALFVVALFFATIAQITPVRIRMVFASSAIALAVSAEVLFLAL
jgi:hypothetical protein